MRRVGARLRPHPLLHLVVTDGGFRPDGTFASWAAHNTARLTEAFRRAVLWLFMRLELFENERGTWRFVRAAGRFPEQMQLVAKDLSLIPPLVEEILRYEAITMSTARMTAVDLDFAGYRIDPGTTVGACLPSASRDPRRFDAPDSFNVRRVDVRPPTFGYGAHFCLGAALARVEMQETMRLLLTRCRAVHLEAKPQWVPFAHIRRFDQLPVTLELR